VSNDYSSSQPGLHPNITLSVPPRVTARNSKEEKNEGTLAQPQKGSALRKEGFRTTTMAMNAFGMRPGIILLREGTDASQVR